MTNSGAAARRVLVVLVVVALCAFGIVQAINRPVGTDTTAYDAEFTDAFGLHRNADVRIRGVRVGKVTDVDLSDDGTAHVGFELERGRALYRADRLAIKFQNLVGQRYVAIDRDDTVDTGEKVPADSTIPLAHTTGSFDVTDLFNGLKPIMKGADPSVLDEFASNVVALIQGDDGVGIGTVLDDIEKLSSFAIDRTALIRVIVRNLGTISDQLKGNSGLIDVLIKQSNVLFGTFEDNKSELITAFTRGSQVFPKLVEIMDRSSDLALGGHDKLDARIMELVPDSAPMGDAVKAVPGLLTQMSSLIDRVDKALTCSNGRAQLPAAAEVLLAGGQVTLCRR